MEYDINFLGTRFFLANLGTGAVDLLVNATENTHLFWASAAEALRMADTGDIKVIYPTRRNLERLALFDSFDAAVTHVAEYPSRIITPYMEMRDGVPWLLIPADAGYPNLLHDHRDHLAPAGDERWGKEFEMERQILMNEKDFHSAGRAFDAP